MAGQAAIGARLEELPPADVLPARADVLCVLALLCVSVALHGWLYFNTYTTARDSIGFAQLALQYESPKQAVVQFPCANPLDVMRRGEPPHPPVYPLIVLGVSKVVRKYHRGTLPEQMLRSTQIASMLGAVLLVIPMYVAAKRLYERRVAFTAALLFQLLPVSAQITSDGLTEAWYLLFVMISLGAAVRAVQDHRLLSAFWAGFWSGMAYLVRPEGLLAALCFGAVLVGLIALNRSRRSVSVRQMPLLILGAAMTALPYMAIIGAFTLKPGGAGMISDVAFAEPAGAGPAIFAEVVDPLNDGARVLWTLKTLAKELTKAFHYAPCFFALIGIGAALARLKLMPEVGLLLMMVFGNLVVIGLHAVRNGYLSERHTLPVVFIGCFFAADGIFRTGDWSVRNLNRVTITGRWTGWFYMVVISASCLPQAIRPLHANRFGHKLIGEHLRDHANEMDVVIDPYTWAQYYSGRSVRGVPTDPNPARYRWAILEDGETPHSTLTRLQAATAVKLDTKNPPVVAAEWIDPADEKKMRKIVLYRQTVP